jgi:hypothetical protein
MPGLDFKTILAFKSWLVSFTIKDQQIKEEPKIKVKFPWKKRSKVGRDS